MKPITCLGAATVAMVLAAPLHAQVDCADWNTQAFFEAAEVYVTRCLQSGADPNARDEKGDTPLHGAARIGSAESVAMLLEAGANPKARTEWGGTPLHIAATTWGDGEAGEVLLQAGADPAARDNDGKLPFDYAKDNEQLKGTNFYWKLRQYGQEAASEWIGT